MVWEISSTNNYDHSFEAWADFVSWQHMHQTPLLCAQHDSEGTHVKCAGFGALWQVTSVTGTNMIEEKVIVHHDRAFKELGNHLSRTEMTGK